MRTLAEGFDPSLGSPLERTVHTDGSCLTRTRVGGWAWVCLAEATERCGRVEDTTSQRMEITAAFEAVQFHDGPLQIVSDSNYVVQCFTQGWHRKWRTNGWRTANKKSPVKNRDLWEPFIELVLARNEIRFTWVKGHWGDPGNERADALASWAARSPSPSTALTE